MTKKLSNGTKKANALSLREFYDKTGQLPLESCLPSRPGDGHNRDSSEYLAHKLASASLYSNGVNGAGRYGVEQAYIKPIAHDALDHHSSGDGYGGGYAGAYGSGRGLVNGSNGRAYGGGIGNGERHAGAAAAGADAAAMHYGRGQQRLDGGSSYGRGPYAGHPDFDAPPKRYGSHSGAGVHVPGSMPPGAADGANAALFLPPPPPPPRASQPQQQLQKQGSVDSGPTLERDVAVRRGSSALVDGHVSNGGVNGVVEALAHKRRLAGPGRVSPVAAGAAEVGVGGAQHVADAGKGGGKLLVEEAEVDAHAQHKDQAPAAPLLEPEQVLVQQQEQPAAPPPPKNEFAARMAQAAAARMANRANSTNLLSGSPTATTTTADAATGTPATAAPPAKPAAVRPTLVLKQHLGFDTTPAARASLPQPEAVARSPAKSLFASGAGAAAADGAAARPKLQLQPRSLPVAAPAAPEPAVERWGSGSVGSDAHSDPARPRIKLLPRGAAAGSNTDGPKPANAAAAAAATGDAAEAAAKRSGSGSSVFGAARPREQVLRERGLDPATAFSASPHPELHLTEAALAARSGNGGRANGSRGASVTSGEDDAWMTVGKHGRAGRAGSGMGSVDGGLAGSYSEDPFALFGSSKAVVAPTRFAVDIGAPHHNPHFARGNGSYNNGGGTYGSYGSHGSPAGKASGGFGGRAEGAAAEEEVDGIFRRALPVRADLLL